MFVAVTCTCFYTGGKYIVKYMANTNVSSRVDYRNSLFRSLSKFNLCKLQCIQNSAARIVSNTSRYTSITPVLKKLHWLPVEQRIVFKTATLVYKYLHTGFPRYFAPYLSSYSSFYSTRHSQSGGNFLVIPKFYPSVHTSVKQFGNSFAFDAPTVWTAIPDEIRTSPSLASFRKQLKTYLYSKAYPPWPGSFPWHSPWCLTPLMSLDTKILSTAFCFVAP